MAKSITLKEKGFYDKHAVKQDLGGLYLHDTEDEAEIYLTAEEFEKVAQLMGYIRRNKQ